MRAVVMAGGEGTRLRPLTSNQPKPLVPIFNKPIMAYVLNHLKQHQIDDVMITLQFLPQMIKNYFGKGTEFGLNLEYSIEEYPLGTAGSVKLGESFLNKGTFVVVAGDVFTDLDLTKLLKYHKKKGAIATLGLISVDDPLEFGVVVTAEDGRIERFVEKPTWGEVISDTINTGIYVLEPEIFDYIPDGGVFDFSKDLFPLLLRAGLPLYGLKMDGYWCDVGSFDQYIKAHQDVLARKTSIEPPGHKMLDDIWIGDGAYIHPSANLSGPLFIGQYARIEEGAQVGEFCVIGNNTIVSENTNLNRAIIWDNSFVGDKVSISGAIIGKNCDVKRGSRVEHGVIIGDSCVIENDAIINHDVKIYPHKIVESGAVINSNIIWESRGRKSIFGAEAVTGLINVDVTPEMALKLGLALGTSLKRGSKILASRDSGNGSRLIKRALIAGLNATGIDVEDLQVSAIPVNRFNIINKQATGGIHVKTSARDRQSVDIKFFNENGIDLSTDKKKSIERLYYREDFRRAHFEEIGQLKYPPRKNENYISSLLGMIDTAAIKDREFKIVADCGSNQSSVILPLLFGQLDLNAILLNSSISEKRSFLSVDDIDLALTNLSKMVKQFRGDIGVLFFAGCENIYLVDDKGQRITVNDSLHLLVKLFSEYDAEKGKIALPVSVSEKAVQIAEANKRKVVRTKVSAMDLMTQALKKDVAFAGAQGGRYIFPRFIPAYDGFFSFMKILEYLSKSDIPLSAILRELPPYYLTSKSLFCPFEKKGELMRKIPAWNAQMKHEYVEGVKFIDKDRWVLVLPDANDPKVSIYSEANSQKEADYLAEDIITFIRKEIL